MAKDEPWISKRLQECKEEHASVTDAVVNRLQALLEGDLGERALTQGELSATAGQLMGDLTKPVAPKEGDGNAN
jgi:hypothetical protein